MRLLDGRQQNDPAPSGVVLDTFLVTGLPGAGKTTTSRLIASRFERAVHIEGDVLSFDFVVSGLPDPFGDDENRAEWGRQMTLREKNMALLADSFNEAGFIVVLDDFATSRSDIIGFQTRLRRSLGLVVLAPPLEVVAARDAGRDKQVFEHWKHSDAEMRRELDGLGLWITDPDLTAPEIAKLVVSAPEATRVEQLA